MLGEVWNMALAGKLLPRLVGEGGEVVVAVRNI
jgi:hypothetical protein